MSTRTAYVLISLCIALFYSGLAALIGKVEAWPVVCAPATFIAAFILCFGALCLGHSAAQAGRS